MRASRSDAIRAWLRHWERLIAVQDFDAARSLFEDDALGFGTVSVRAEGLEALVEQQWKAVWSRTSDFTFLDETLCIWTDGALDVVAVQWLSTGRDSRTGEPFARRGRATIVLREAPAGLRAIHTHFSIDPQLERFLPQ